MLKVTNLRKMFGNFPAIQDVSFDAQAGEIFGLLGPNGAGKTTTIRLISTVLVPTSGDVTVAGYDIVRDSENVRRNIGILTADVGVYDRYTTRENLRYFGELYGLHGPQLESRIDDLVTMLEMERFANRRAGKFSTGMKQKVAIARSIIHDPKVVIFDEPTAGLDVLASQTVITMMKTFRQQGKLVVLSTHDMFDAERLCDRVVILHRGTVVAGGSVPDIRTKTATTSLEDAFLKIIGEDAARQATLDAETQSLKTTKRKRGFPWRR